VISRALFPTKVAQADSAAKSALLLCIINILESVSFCTESKTKGFLLAIDQAKAFDTVDHNFIRETYKFFGFDETFIKMLEITTMGRNATIVFDTNEHTHRATVHHHFYLISANRF
jgi:Reverse transcriptase (RNA-dependent DNA polymerase)